MGNTTDTITMSKGRGLKGLWVLLLLGCTGLATAQAPVLETFMTKDNLLIGEPSTLKIRATYPANGYTVNWFNLSDSLPHFEVVEAEQIDSVVADGMVRMEQKIRFTSFDSGQWTTPQLQVNFMPQAGGQALSLQTDAMPFQVHYMPDTTRAIQDIKPIMQGETVGWPWWFFAIGIGILALLALLGWLLYRYLSQKMPAMAPVKPSLYRQTMQGLEALRQLNVTQTEPCRQFHTQLASLFKAYMAQRLGVSLTHQTTGDTLMSLKKRLDVAQLATVADALRGCDAVKFARFMPNKEQCHQWLSDIKACIEQIEKKEVAE
jgi:hypothetical protein